MPADTIRLFSTCPQSKDVARGDYLALVRRVAQWSEAAGCTGMLIYTDNSIVDPWLVGATDAAGHGTIVPAGRGAAGLYGALHRGEDGRVVGIAA